MRAVYLKRIFEVNAVLCVRCEGEMKLVGVILDDVELDWILAHQGWPMDFPKTRRYQDFLSRVCAGPEGSRPMPARSPPNCASDIDGAGQEDPYAERWDGRQDWPWNESEGDCGGLRRRLLRKAG